MHLPFPRHLPRLPPDPNDHLYYFASLRICCPSICYSAAISKVIFSGKNEKWGIVLFSETATKQNNLTNYIFSGKTCVSLTYNLITLYLSEWFRLLKSNKYCYVKSIYNQINRDCNQVIWK